MIFGFLGSVFCFLSVAIGAFAAHGLRGKVSEEYLAIVKTGAEYQFYHGLALLIIYGLHAVLGKDRFAVPGFLFMIGTIVFSGSLYLLVALDKRWLGAVTPIGGTSFLIGWLWFAYLILKS